jgi:hypothetical protein
MNETLIKYVVIVLDEFDDNGKILEKTIKFKVPVSNELAGDFGKWLEDHKDQKYKVRLEDCKE